MKITVRSGQDSGRSGTLGAAAFVIGRDASCDLTLADDKVSRRHASVELDGDRVTLRDLGSTNGVFVGGLRVTDASELKVGQPFRVGDTVLAVEADATRPAPRPAPAAANPVPPPSWEGGGASTPAADRADAVGNSTSTFRRMMLERSVRRTSILASLLAVVVVVLVVLLVTGVLPPGDNGDGDGTVASTVRDAMPSTVLVSARIGDTVAGHGTGWVLDADKGLVVTNHHVVDGGTNWRVGVGGKNQAATLVATSPCDDLALLRIRRTTGLRTMPLGSQTDLQQGDHVVALGFPANVSERDDLATSDGIVSVVRTRTKGDIEDLPNVVRTTAAINPGNSGGPLLTLRGQLVGVNTLTTPSRQNEGYAIGVDRVKQVVPSLRAGRSRYFTGFSLLPTSELPDGLLARLGLPQVDGYFVIGAVPGTPAARSSIVDQPAIVVGVNNRRMDGTTSEYCKAVARRSPPTVQYVVPGSTAVHTTEVPFTR